MLFMVYSLLLPDEKSGQAMRLLLFVLFSMVYVFSYSQSIEKDTISTVGIFDGKKINLGVFGTEKVYQINDYCIFLADMSESKIDSLKGKKVKVSGQLKIVEGEYGPTLSSNDGTIYEPVKDPDRKYICKPCFTIVCDSIN